MADPDAPTGRATGWERVVCDPWRAGELREVTGLHTVPYGDDPTGLLPPTFLVAQRTDPAILGVPDAPVRLNAGNWCRWEAPVTAGEALERQTTVEEVSRRSGRSGELVFYRLVTAYRRQGSMEIVARASTTTIRRRASSGVRRREAGRDEPPADAEQVLEVTPSSRDVVRYAAATGDFYEVHYDTDFARARGLPGTITHGLLKLAYLARAAAEWGGHGTVVRELRASYRGMDRVGAPFRVLAQPRGVVGRARELALYGVSAHGAVNTVGSALIHSADDWSETQVSSGSDGAWTGGGTGAGTGDAARARGA